MKDALLLVIGSLISALVGIATSKIFMFRQLKSRATEAFVEATSSDNLIRFIDNCLLVREIMAPAAIALEIAGHRKAAKEVTSVAKDLTSALSEVLMKTSGGGVGHHSVPTEFKINAWEMLNSRKDFGTRLLSIQPDRGVILEPHW